MSGGSLAVEGLSRDCAAWVASGEVKCAVAVATWAAVGSERGIEVVNEVKPYAKQSETRSSSLKRLIEEIIPNFVSDRISCRYSSSTEG